MPSIDGEAAAGYSGGSMSGGSVAPVVEAGELCEVLRRAHGVEEILMLDCRGADDYRAGHIRGAVSVGLSSLMLRRLASGKLSLPQVVRHLAADGGDRLARLHQCVPIVLYDHAHASNPLTPTLMTILCRKFNQEGCIAHCLSGGFEEFRSRFPEWCESALPNEPPIVGFKSLRITCLEAEEDVEGACDSSLGRDTPLDDLGFPVEILPHLFLGNAKNSGDRDALNRHKIRYIINVTPNLPNVFENCGNYKYMQIPIADHWSQNLASFFPQAIQFIGSHSVQSLVSLVLANHSRDLTGWTPDIWLSTSPQTLHVVGRRHTSRDAEPGARSLSCRQGVRASRSKLQGAQPTAASQECPGLRRMGSLSGSLPHKFIHHANGLSR
nr:dual specificity protein phosphatase 7-like [Penaeus vannamei]